MTLQDFIQSAEQESTPPVELDPSLLALWWAEKGEWDRAHTVVQDMVSATGSWVHANLHRGEGDLGNARYWYNRAGKPESSASIEEERHAIISALL